MIDDGARWRPIPNAAGKRSFRCQLLGASLLVCHQARVRTHMINLVVSICPVRNAMVIVSPTPGSCLDRRAVDATKDATCRVGLGFFDFTPRPNSVSNFRHYGCTVRMFSFLTDNHRIRGFLD